MDVERGIRTEAPTVRDSSPQGRDSGLGASSNEDYHFSKVADIARTIMVCSFEVQD